MTSDEMNGNLVRIGSLSRFIALTALAGALTGCAAYDPFNQGIDPNSAAAQRVEALARADDSYPRWADFPAAPQNVPTPREIRNQVQALEAADAQLNRQVAAIDWTLDERDGDPWARRVRNRIDPRLAQPVDPAEVAEALRWAQALRERSDPPPQIND